MEEWRNITGFEGYQVSDQGRVKSLKYKEPRILKPAYKNGKYLSVTLSKNGKLKNCWGHRLVAQEFCTNFCRGFYKKPQVNHINGDKTDNRAENLEWVTAKENMKHAWKTGLAHHEPRWICDNE